MRMVKTPTASKKILSALEYAIGENTNRRQKISFTRSSTSG
jgi:hypothetical protein